MIRVIIERHIADDLAEHYENAARSTLQQAMNAQGFISGEALHDVSEPNHRYVIVVYRSVADWQRWYGSQERKEMMNVIRPMLETDEKITVLEH